jgi:hypothetical protein
VANRLSPVVHFRLSGNLKIINSTRHDVARFVCVWKTLETESRVQAGSSTSTVALLVAGDDEN